MDPGDKLAGASSPGRDPDRRLERGEALEQRPSEVIAHNAATGGTHTMASDEAVISACDKASVGSGTNACENRCDYFQAGAISACDSKSDGSLFGTASGSAVSPFEKRARDSDSVKTRILAVLRSDGSELGLTADEVQSQLSNRSLSEVKSAVEALLLQDNIFNTIDEKHYASI